MSQDASPTPLFTFVSEDTDGSAHKSSQQAHAESRAAEYRSVATEQDGDPNTPSGRTVGVTLLYSKRADRTKDALTRNAALADDPTTPLWAEDLVLGYRVDVKHGSEWLSLCARTGSYKIFDAQGKEHPWEPAAGLERCADDGFVSPMATSPVPDPNDPDPDPLIQVHQSIFTWTGWSLSVKPLFKSINEDKNGKPKCSDTKFRIHPTYRLPGTGKGQLPPLRFDRPYTFRCRAVDLAGNSVDVGVQDQPSGAVMDQVVMQRIEPIRPPHVLLNQPLLRTSAPGEQVDLMVIRDGKGETGRTLVAPREPLRMAELHDELKSAELPESAFKDFILRKDGSFPSVMAAYKSDLLPSKPEGSKYGKEWNDPLFLRKGGSAPDCPYYPDPLARFVRLSPRLVLDRGIDPNEGDPLEAFHIGLYLDPDFDPRPTSTWPNCGPVRIRLERSNDSLPHAFKKLLLIDENDATAGVMRGLVIQLPKARTVVLTISSAACQPNQTSQFPSGSNVALWSMHNQFVQKQNHPDLEATLAEVLDGTHAMQTPMHGITLVHAVRRPLEQPWFEGFDVRRAIGKTEATVSGKIHADWWSTGKVTCHAIWEDCIDDLKKPAPTNVQTSEVAFDLRVDSASARHAEGKMHLFRDTRAHSVTYELRAGTRFREYYPKNDDPSSFEVKCKEKEEGKKRDGEECKGRVEIVVKNSVRPPAPSIAYIVPAFKWEDGYSSSTKTRVRGRISALRLYLERPFRVTGNAEGIAFVLVPPGLTDANDTRLQLGSRWGLDPIWRSGDKLGMRELAASDFAGGKAVVDGCYLAETKTTVSVVPYEVAYAPDRGLWFCDVRINSVDAYYPFVRLGVVRFQPDSLSGDVSREARMSPVVIADFMQIAPNRWVHLQKKDGRNVSISISGVTYSDSEASPDPKADPACPGTPPATLKHSTFQLTVQQRWHAIGKNLGWRPVDCQPIPNCTSGTAADGINTWRYDLNLPHSSSTHQYRLLIEEYEWLMTDETTMMDHPTASKRLVYADFFEL